MKSDQKQNNNKEKPTGQPKTVNMIDWVVNLPPHEMLEKLKALEMKEKLIVEATESTPEDFSLYALVFEAIGGEEVISLLEKKLRAIVFSFEENNLQSQNEKLLHSLLFTAKSLITLSPEHSDASKSIKIPLSTSGEERNIAHQALTLSLISTILFELKRKEATLSFSFLTLSRIALQYKDHANVELFLAVVPAFFIIEGKTEQVLKRLELILRDESESIREACIEAVLFIPESWKNEKIRVLSEWLPEETNSDLASLMVEYLDSAT